MAYSAETDKKWQKNEETQLYKFDKEKLDKKLYCLRCFHTLQEPTYM